MGVIGLGALGRAILTALCGLLLTAAVAVAGDANRLPPNLELTAAGAEGIVGPNSEALAYFSTSDLSGSDPSSEYPPGSRVTFRCSIDERPVRCPAEYIPTIEGFETLRRGTRGPDGERLLPSSFHGFVAVPTGLPSGPHTVRVVATDEDGTDPDPPSVTVTMDRRPPSAPALIAMPPRRSRVHKPNFRFVSEDDVRFVRRYDRTSFVGRLRRISPSPEVFRGGGRDAGSFEPWVQSCPSLLTCTGRAAVNYLVPGWGGLSLGMKQWLPAGDYELRLGARDAAGNKSPLTKYRFTILRGRSPNR